MGFVFQVWFYAPMKTSMYHKQKMEMPKGKKETDHSS